MDIVSYAISKKYTKDTADSLGSLRGAPCTIQSITDIEGGHRITFAWTGTSGSVQTSSMDVMNGADGEDGADGKTPVITISDIVGGHSVTFAIEGSTPQTFDVMDGVKGDKGEDGEQGEAGFSPAITVKTHTDNTYILTITTAEGSFDTPNLYGGSAGGASVLSDLEDVSLSSLKNGQILKYNSATGKWVNADGIEIEKLGDIADVDLNALKDGQVIAWDNANQKWVNVDVANPMQYSTMVSADTLPQKVVQYIGVDTANYKRGYFYYSEPYIESGNLSYRWAQIDTQPSNRNYEDLDNTPQINDIDIKGNKTSVQLGLQGQIQFDELPTASALNSGTILHYVGVSTADRKSGYFYQSSYDTETGAYKWVQKDVSDNAALSAAVQTLQNNQGDMSTLEISGANTLVSAINALNRKDLQGITYNEPTLVITYKNGEHYDFNVKTILNETQIGELANVLDENIANGNVLQYDTAINRYKPYDLLTSLTNLLNDSKSYTDEKVASSIQQSAYVVDEKPIYDAENDTVIYKQSGEIKTTQNTEARFYYEDSEGTPYCTSWIDDIEFSYSISTAKFEDYVNKNTDIVSTYAEDMADKVKVPNVAALDSLLAIVKNLLSEKVNVADIIDNLTSQETQKPLSAKQGKALNDLVNAKNDRFQYVDMPTADSSISGVVRQYVGVSSSAFTTGKFYTCLYDSENDTWYWSEIKYSADTDSELSGTSENPVQNKVIKEALDDKQNATMSAPITINGTEYETVESAIGAILALANLKQPSTLETPITVDGVAQTTVENALGALANKTVSVDNSTIIRDSVTGELSAIKATSSTIGVVKPDNEGIEVDSNGTLSVKNRLVVTDTLPTATAELLNATRLYIGSTTTNYQEGGIYKCESDGQTPPTYAWNIKNKADIDLSLYKKIFTGTQATWNTLTDAQKKEYDIANITDDTEDSVVDEVADGDMRAVTSNSVFNVLSDDTESTSIVKRNFGGMVYLRIPSTVSCASTFSAIIGSKILRVGSGSSGAYVIGYYGTNPIDNISFVSGTMKLSGGSTAVKSFQYNGSDAIGKTVTLIGVVYTE